MKRPERTSFLLPLRVSPGISRPNFVLLAAAAVRCTHETCTQVRFAMDSAVEGSGFEPSVPLQVLIVSRSPLVVSVTRFRKERKSPLPRTGDRGFESTSLQRRVLCEPNAGGPSPTRERS